VWSWGGARYHSRIAGRGVEGIPLGILAGYTIVGADGPVLDIDPYFDMPFFFTPGERSATDTKNYGGGITPSGYFYL
jgi:hypothetical protein